MKSKEWIASSLEVTEIFVDATKEVTKDTLAWLGNVVAKVDAWMCDYGDEE